MAADDPLPLPWLLPYAHNSDVIAAALQELRNVRPLLHSAAEYYEIAYLNRNKQDAYAAKQSAQEYCTKVLVNSVDHLGTVASHLDECLSLVAVEISKLEVSVARIVGRFCASKERTTLNGLTQFRRMRPMKPRYLKYYDSEGKHFPSLPHLSPRKFEEVFQANAGSDSGGIKSLSWYLTFESSSSLAGNHLQARKSFSFSETKDDTVSNGEQIARSLLSDPNPNCTQAFDNFAKELLYDSSNSLGLLLMRDSLESTEETID